MTASERIREARETASRKAAELSKGMTTQQIVAAFAITDALLADGLTDEQYMQVCHTRGWMIEELGRRDELFLIGLGDTVKEGR
jgi:hypothetical protein